MSRGTRTTRRMLLAAGAACLTLLIAACSPEPMTSPSRARSVPARSPRDRDGGCMSDDNAPDLPVVDCDSTSLATSRSGYLVAAGHK